MKEIVVYDGEAIGTLSRGTIQLHIYRQLVRYDNVKTLLVGIEELSTLLDYNFAAFCKNFHVGSFRRRIRVGESTIDVLTHQGVKEAVRRLDKLKRKNNIPDVAWMSGVLMPRIHLRKHITPRVLSVGAGGGGGTKRKREEDVVDTIESDNDGPDDQHQRKMSRSKDGVSDSHVASDRHEADMIMALRENGGNASLERGVVLASVTTGSAAAASSSSVCEKHAGAASSVQVDAAFDVVHSNQRASAPVRAFSFSSGETEHVPSASVALLRHPTFRPLPRVTLSASAFAQYLEIRASRLRGAPSNKPHFPDVPDGISDDAFAEYLEMRAEA